MDTLLQDLRYTFRTLNRSRAFTTAVILMLALGIGATSAIFSVVNGVLLQPLPYRDPGQLVRVMQTAPAEGVVVTDGAFSPQDFEDFEREKPGYERLAAWYEDAATLLGGGEPEEVAAAWVSAGFFETLGVGAAVGRGLIAEENVVGADHSIVLSDGLWRRRFGSDRSIVGRTVSLDGETFVVVGVMPPAFAFPARDTDIWLPVSLIREDDIPRTRGLRWLSVLGRLESGLTIETASTSTNTLLARLEREYPATNTGWGTGEVVPLKESMVRDVRPALAVLLAAVALVLLIVCVNLANLLLARGAARAREFAIRAAVGARGTRIIRQLLTESITLALAGGLLGLLLAFWGVDVLLALSAGTIPRPDEIQPDARVVGFTLVVSLATGIVFGLMPAFRASAVSFHDTLKESGRGETVGGGGGLRRRRARTLLVVAETALAVVLLSGAGLMIRSLWNLAAIDPGFRGENVLALGVSTDGASLPDESRRNAYRRELIRSLEDIPGVLAVGGSKTLVLEGGGEPYGYSLPGRTSDSSVAPESGTYIVTPGYFRALGIPFVSGRTFREAADDDPRTEVIINQALADRYWPDEDPVGKIMRIGETDFPIVGVVGNVRNDGINQPASPAAYVPGSVFQRSNMTLYVRTSRDPLRMIDAITAAVRQVNPNQPISNVTTLPQLLTGAIARPRFYTLLLGIFGTLALVLAALGVYGVLSYGVSQRRHEMGIRMALGARAGDVLRMILKEGMVIAFVGLAAGLVAAFAATRVLGSLLYGVDPADPATFMAVAGLLACVALLAIYVPARRAARLNPSVALRSE
ncbi:MAG: ABC transporter permease [Gemmatimonadaceae bacterium]